MTLPRASSIGPEALRALRPGRRGRVEALFARSCYVRFRDDWICIGEASIGQGPLNVLLPDAPAVLRRLRLRAPAGTAPGLLRLGDAALDLGHAMPWRPLPPPAWTPASLARGLGALAAGLPGDIPTEGLAWFLRPGAMPQGPVARAAEPAVGALSDWLVAPAGTARCPADAVRRLLGLGPGLTPSGDDFLAGAMATLRAIGRPAAAEQLRASVERSARGATSPLSAAHLRAAFQVGLGERLHGLLRDILAGEQAGMRGALRTLAACPQCSPWDALAGCSVALRRDIAAVAA